MVKKKNWREWLKSLELSKTYGFQILFHCDSTVLHSSSYYGFRKVTSATFSLLFQLIKASWFQCLWVTQMKKGSTLSTRLHLDHQKITILNEERRHEAEYHTLDSGLRPIRVKMFPFEYFKYQLQEWLYSERIKLTC